MLPVKEGWVSHLHFQQDTRQLSTQLFGHMCVYKVNTHLILSLVVCLYIFRDGDGDILYCFVPGDEQMACLGASGGSLFVCFLEFVFKCVPFINKYKSSEHEYPN